MAQIKKRGEFQWMARIRRKGYPEQTETFTTKAAAEAWARDIESKMDKATFIDLSPLLKTTFKDLADRYLKEVTPTKASSKSEKSLIKRILELFVKVKSPLANIEPADITDFRDEMLKEFGGAYVTKMMNRISHIYTIAASEWRFRGLKNPVEGVRRPPQPRGRDRRVEDENGEPSEEEAQWIVGVTQSVALRALIPVAVETAMRRGEMASIRWRDVNLDDQIIRLYDTKNGEDRTVPLSTRAVAILRALPRKNEQVFGVRPDSMTQAFIRARERARRLYEKDCKENGIEPSAHFLNNIRLHDMRHEATTRLFEDKGLETSEVMSITGHKSSAMLRRYTHLNAKKLAKKLG